MNSAEVQTTIVHCTVYK